MIIQEQPSANNAYKFWALLFSILYAYILANLPIDKFDDRGNYLNYLASAAELMQTYSEKGILGVLANEPLWLILNIILGTFFEPENALQVLIFISSFIFSAAILFSGKKNYSFLFFAIFICLTPQIVKNFILHLRQGVGISIAMLIYVGLSSSKHVLTLLVTPFIHSSFFFVGHNFLIEWWAKKSKKGNENTTFVIALLISCITITLFLFLLSGVDARQVNQYDGTNSEPRSGIGFVVWLIIFIIFISDTSQSRLINIFAVSSIANYLILYFVFDPVARIFESTLPFVFLAGFNLTKKPRQIIILVFCALFLYQWISPILMGGSVFKLAE